VGRGSACARLAAAKAVAKRVGVCLWGGTVSKYRNKPCSVGSESYRSQRERDRHQQLLLLQHAGHIIGLRREVPYELAPRVKLVGEARARPAVRYVADFVYELACGTPIVEDAKGMHTPVYRLKKHLMATIHGIHVQEV
jgi:hypothetical protein